MANLNPYESPAVVEAVEPHCERYLTAELDQVRRGLRFVYYGIVAALAAVVSAPAGLMLAALTGFTFLEPFAMVGIALFALVGMVSIFWGQVQCLSAPAESEGRGMVVGALAMHSLSTLAWTGTLVASSVAFANPAFVGITMIFAGLSPFFMIVAGAIGMLFFLSFMKRLNGYLGNQSLVRSVSNTMMLSAIVAVGCILLVGGYFTFALMAPRGTSVIPVGLGLITLALMVTLLVVFVRFANVVIYTSRELAKLPRANKFSEGRSESELLSET